MIKNTEYPLREEFDDAIHKELKGAGVELVCLAGFMRILSGKSHYHVVAPMKTFWDTWF